MKILKCILMVASVTTGIGALFATNLQGAIAGGALCIAFSIAAAAES